MALKKVVRPWLAKGKTKERPWIKDNSSFSEDTSLYNSQWRKLAKIHKQNNPLCVECKAKGIIRAAAVTDHIKPTRLFPELAYDWNNLQSLCTQCHNSKSASEKNKNREYFKD